MPKIGLVTCVHPLYDLPSVAVHREKAIAALRASGCEVVPAAVPRTSADAVDLAASLRQADIDLLLLFFCTWVGEDVTLALSRELMDVPMLMWALPHLDRDIPMPSPMSGISASASNIRRLGKRFTHVVGQATSEVMDEIARAARAGAAVRALRRARFGVVGYPCPGMMDVGVDEADLQKALGMTAVHLDLDVLLRRADAAPRAEAAAAAGRLTAAAGGAHEAAPEAVADNLRLYVAMKQLVEENGLDAYCVRCWPELRDHRKITACSTHALMGMDGISSTCEVDLTALATTFVLSRLAGHSAFNFDLTAVLEPENALQFAHCGAADPRLAADRSAVRLRSHMRTGTGVTVEFPFRQGPVTLAKLMRPRDGRLRLFVGEGRAIDGGDVRGTVATVQPEPSAKAFLDVMIREAVEHHVAIVYGSWRRELEMFCEFTGVEFLPAS